MKRRLREHFRRHGKPKQFGGKVFVTAIIIAIRQSRFHIQELVVDLEYPGYERNMIELLKRHLPDVEVYFSSIGRKSPAHYAAYGVYIKKRGPDARTSTREILRVLKNGSRTVTPSDGSRAIRSPR